MARPMTFAAFAALAADVTAALFAERASAWRSMDGAPAGLYDPSWFELNALAVRDVDSLVDQYRSDPSLPLVDALASLVTLAPMAATDAVQAIQRAYAATLPAYR